MLPLLKIIVALALAVGMYVLSAKFEILERKYSLDRFGALCVATLLVGTAMFFTAVGLFFNL